MSQITDRRVRCQVPGPSSDSLVSAPRLLVIGADNSEALIDQERFQLLPKGVTEDTPRWYPSDLVLSIGVFLLMCVRMAS